MKNCIRCGNETTNHWEVDEGRYACEKCWHSTYKSAVEAHERRMHEFDQDLTGQDEEAYG